MTFTLLLPTPLCYVGLGCAANPQSLFKVWHHARTWLNPHTHSLPSENLSNLLDSSTLVYHSFSTRRLHGQSDLLSSAATQSLLSHSGNNTFSKILGSITLGRTLQTWVLERYQLLQLSAVSWVLLSNMQLKPLPHTASHDSGSCLWLTCFY